MTETGQAKIIAVDIGNSTTYMAIVKDRKVHDKTTLVNDRQIDSLDDELRRLVERLDHQQVVPVVICSVVPELTRLVTQSVGDILKGNALVIGETIPLPLKLNLSDAASVGHDRVVAAAMAYERMQTAVVVADFGTAVTIDCVDRDGVFRGGAILPGLTMSARALARETDAVPLIEPATPNTSWGRNTAEAVSVGIIFGMVGALREIVERYAADLGAWPEVIATGGDANRIVPHCDFVHAVVPDLLLMGIEVAYDRWLEETTV